MEVRRRTGDVSRRLKAAMDRQQQPSFAFNLTAAFALLQRTAHCCSTECRLRCAAPACSIHCYQPLRWVLVCRDGDARRELRLVHELEVLHERQEPHAASPAFLPAVE